MNAPRRHFTTDQKAAILKRYLVDKVLISDLCDEYGIKPNQIYAWQKILFDNAPAAFHTVAKRQAKRLSALGEGLQGVHPHLRDDARAHESVLSAEQWKAGAVSRKHQRRAPSPRRADLVGRRRANRCHGARKTGHVRAR